MSTYGHITRRNFIATTGAASASLILGRSGQTASASQTSAGSNARKPNILYIFSDQQRYSALGSSGNKIIKTPNLDHLADQGIVFDQACSSHPLCSPYRAHLMTGRYGFKNGVVDNEYKLRDDQAFLPRELKRTGYHTGYVGKWHLGYGPYTEDKRYGFDYMAAYDCQHAYFETTYHENEQGPKKMDGWAPKVETDLAIKFIEEHQRKNGDSPFALVICWGPPHWPYNQYPNEYKIYDPAKVDLPKNVPFTLADFARKEIADYYGNVTGLDAQVGRLMETLDKLGLTEDTIVCFSSDHGDHLSSHGYGNPGYYWLHHSKRASKSTPYEEAAHIPLIMRFPRRVKAGQRTQAMFSSVDVMPTLLGLCGLDIPDGVQGHNLAHVATGKDGPEPPDSVYLMNMGPGWPYRGKWVGFWRGLRTEQWTYARWINDDDQGPLLFDRKNDPFEMKNLVGNAKFADVQKRLEARLKQWMDETGDPFETGQRDPKTGMLKLGQKFASEHWYRRG